MATQYNVNLIGSLTNTNGVLSGFSSGNYASLSKNFSPNQNPYEIVFKFNSSSISDEQVIFQAGNLQSSDGLIGLEVYESKIYFELDKNSSPVCYIHGTTVLQSNTDYYAKLTYDGIDTYTIYSSTNGSNWTTEGTVTSQDYLGNTSNSYIGINQDTNSFYFIGTIDLNGSYIKLNDVYFWRGTTSVTTIQLRRDTAANWTTANPVLAEGEVGIETDTRKQKFGDGTTAWNSLSYSNGDMKQNVLTAGSNIQINGDTISATNTTYSTMTISEGTTGTATTARTMRADRLKSIIQGTKLTGLDTNYYTPITATDNILGALGKLQVGVDDANSMYDYKADDFIPDSPLVESWQNIGVVFVEGVGEIDTDGILSSNTNDGWCNGQLPEMQSTNLINDYWEWSGMFRSASISSEVETIAIDGVNNGGFVFYIQPNGNITNPDDNNKVLANVYFNDWVRFTIIHQPGETNITITFDNAQGGTTTTTTALATTASQFINSVSWRLNVSPKIDYIVGTECYFRTAAGGTKYFFTKRHIGIDNKAFDGQWMNVFQEAIGSTATTIAPNSQIEVPFTSLPAKTCEVIFSLSQSTNYNLAVSSSLLTSTTNRVLTGTGCICVIMPVSSDKKVRIRNLGSGTASVNFVRMCGYRVLGTNTNT